MLFLANLAPSGSPFVPGLPGGKVEYAARKAARRIAGHLDGNAEFGAGLGSPTLPVERGAAVGYFNASGYTLVLSTAASFLSSVIHAPHRNLLRCGVQGAASSIP